GRPHCPGAGLSAALAPSARIRSTKRTFIMQQLRVWFFAVLISASFSAAGQLTNVFEFRDGDRVVLIGDTFIEREQSYGYVEHMLTTHYPARNISFRNLGWSADTPVGVSRAGFDPPEKGFDRITEQLQ